MTSAPSPLERAVIDLVATKYWPAFRGDDVAVVSRKDTGVGRYTYFVDRSEQALVDGTYGVSGRYVEMEGIPNGLFFVLEVRNSRIASMELVTCGGDSWDGVERAWKIA